MIEKASEKEWLQLGFRLQIVLDHCGVKEKKQREYWEQFKRIRSENDRFKFNELIDQIYDDSLVFGEGKPTESSKDFHPMFDLIVGNLLKKKIAEDEE